jgi:hypothetical protein
VCRPVVVTVRTLGQPGITRISIGHDRHVTRKTDWFEENGPTITGEGTASARCTSFVSAW